MTKSDSSGTKERISLLETELKKLEKEKRNFWYTEFVYGFFLFIGSVIIMIIALGFSNGDTSNTIFIGAAILVVAFWIVRRYKISQYNKRVPEINAELSKLRPPKMDDDIPMTSKASYEHREWMHTLEELDKAKTALRNLEARKSSMSTEQYEKEKKYLEFLVNDWKEKSENQYQVYKRADS